MNKFLEKFEDFDCKVLEFKTVVIMKGNFGRKRRLSALVVTGNKKGLAGFAMGKALEGRIALRKARNRSGQKLMHIRLYNDHTGRSILIKYLRLIILKTFSTYFF